MSNANTANLNTMSFSNLLQMQHQATQLKLLTTEADIRALKSAYTELGSKVNIAVQALTTATAAFEDGVKKLNSLEQQLRASAKGSSAGDHAGSNTHGDIPLAVYDAAEFHETVCWEESDFANDPTARDREIVPSNKSLRFLRYKDGTIIDGKRGELIRSLLRQCLRHLAEQGHKIPNYTEVSTTVLRYCQHEIYPQFPEVNYCSNHWKFRFLYMSTYSSFKQNNPDICLQKERTVKAERASSVLRAHIPTSHARSAPTSTAAPSRLASTTPSADLYVLDNTPHERLPSPTIAATNPALAPVTLRHERASPPTVSSAVLTIPPRHAPLKRARTASDGDGNGDDEDDSDNADKSIKRPKTTNDERAILKVSDPLAGVMPLATPDLPTTLEGPTSATSLARAVLPTAKAGDTAAVVATPAKSKERAWKPGAAITPFNIFAQEYHRNTDATALHSVVKSAFDALTSAEQKVYNDRKTEIKKAKFPNLPAYFASLDNPSAATA
ncbi:hypothetical protein EV714DRAFT_276682 [Schizophyllum commune]